jgi:hypothetical protein
MHDAGCQTGQPAQAAGVIQIGHQGPDALRPQPGPALRTGSDGGHADARRHLAGHPKADVTTADQQHALATKTGRQGT